MRRVSAEVDIPAFALAALAALAASAAFCAEAQQFALNHACECKHARASANPAPAAKVVCVLLVYGVYGVCSFF